VSRLLLDTHALLWALIEPARIPTATLDTVRDPGTTLLVSAASAWEIATEHRMVNVDLVTGRLIPLRRKVRTGCGRGG
jgi:PIN domain nuclease of toxin-antitoxin system